jgi:hypothetical protein
MTRAQRRAAKHNAQHSTGPRTPEGKAASSRNATRHNLSGATFVLLPNEDPAAFEALARGYRDEWHPRTPHETFLVTQMVQARWRLDRITRMEAELMDTILETFGEGRTDEGALLMADGVNPDPFRRLHRYAQDAQRSYHRAVREFRACRAQEPRPAEPSQISENRRVAARPNHAPSTACVEIQNEPGEPAKALAAAGGLSSGSCFSLQSEYCPPSPPALSPSIQALSTR